jgi:hypothetical protein
MFAAVLTTIASIAPAGAAEVDEWFFEIECGVERLLEVGDEVYKVTFFCDEDDPQVYLRSAPLGIESLQLVAALDASSGEEELICGALFDSDSPLVKIEESCVAAPGVGVRFEVELDL